ncbi:sensor histidine kinase [Mucilaginibacter sp. HD30]
MEPIEQKRNYPLIVETVLLVALASLYVIGYLVKVYNKWEELYIDGFKEFNFSRAMVKHDIGDFLIRTHVQWPIIIASILLLSGWAVFHAGVIPRVVKRVWNLRIFLLITLSIVLIATSLFVYHYFREYFRYYLGIDYNSNDIRFRHLYPNGIKIYSLYRLRTLVTDLFGVFVAFGMLELALGACHRFRLLLQNETDAFYRVITYLPLLLFAMLLIFITLALRLQTPLWTENLRYVLYLGGSGLIVWLMQEFITVEFKPELMRTDSGKFYVLLSGLVAIWLGLNLVVWLCYSYFEFNRENDLVAMLIMTLFAALVIAVLRRYSFKSKTKLERLSSATLAELSQLRTQLNPHFLFNSLNSLYTAAHREKSEATAEGIQRLADIMRFILSENNHERILLEKEIQYLENYLYIQRLRVDETQGVDITVSLTVSTPHAYIAPMMLIPFVENAFKHGISHRSPSWIHVGLTVENGKLDFHVANSRHKKSAHDPEEFQGGIGMPNIRKRLELIYAHRYTLDIKETNDEYSAKLTLQLW